MLPFLLRRLSVAILVAFTVSVLAFLLVRLSGDPAVALAGEGASAADVERVRETYGLNEPIWITYGQWIGRTIRGDFGYSYPLRADVSALLADHLPVTLTLAGMALIVAIVVAIPLGVLSGLHPNTIVDRIAMGISVVGQALPTFWLGLLLLLYFGLYWRLLPTSGIDGGVASFFLPAVTLGFYSAPGLMRLTRAGVIEAMSSDYVRTARAKGLGQTTIVLRHVLRNAMIPVVSLTAVQLGLMLGGSIVTEAVFSLPGLGQLAWQSIQRSDVQVVQAIVLIVSLMYLLLTLIADLLNALLDPRIRVD